MANNQPGANAELEANAELDASPGSGTVKRKREAQKAAALHKSKQQQQQQQQHQQQSQGAGTSGDPPASTEPAPGHQMVAAHNGAQSSTLDISDLFAKAESNKKLAEKLCKLIKKREATSSRELARLDQAEQNITLLNVKLDYVRSQEAVRKMQLEYTQTQMRHNSIAHKAAERESQVRTLSHEVHMVNENIHRITSEFSEAHHAEAELALELAGNHTPDVDVSNFDGQPCDILPKLT